MYTSAGNAPRKFPTANGIHENTFGLYDDKKYILILREAEIRNVYYENSQMFFRTRPISFCFD